MANYNGLTEIKSERVKETCGDQRQNNKSSVSVCVWFHWQNTRKFDRAAGNYVTSYSAIRNDHKLFAGHNKLTTITNVYEAKFICCARVWLRTIGRIPLLLFFFFSSVVSKRTRWTMNAAAINTHKQMQSSGKMQIGLKQNAFANNWVHINKWK